MEQTTGSLELVDIVSVGGNGAKYCLLRTAITTSAIANILRENAKFCREKSVTSVCQFLCDFMMGLIGKLRLSNLLRNSLTIGARMWKYRPKLCLHPLLLQVTSYKLY